MPNHVSNRLTITGESEAVARLYSEIAGDAERPCIDFNRIAPMPEVLKYTGSGTATIDGQKVSSWWRDAGAAWDDPARKPDRLLTAAEEAEIASTGFPDWYEWSIANWGTKWNAYSQTRLSDDAIYFETAWAAPEPVIAALNAKYPGLELKLEFADEDRGSNAGTLWFGGMERSSTELDGPEAVALWFDLNSGCDPKEYGYDPTTWEYVGE